MNRYIRWPVGDDPEYEADPRHAQIIPKEVNSPIVKRDLHIDGDLPSAQVTTYRSFTRRGAYLAQDRYDIQHATKALATDMKSPTHEVLVRLKRLARYLKATPRVVQRSSGRAHFALSYDMVQMSSRPKSMQ